MEILSPGHLIPLLIITAILFFGWKQLPDMARSVGRSLRIFKTEMKGMADDDKARQSVDGNAASSVEAAVVAPAVPPEVAQTPATVPPAVNEDEAPAKPTTSDD